MKKYAVQVPFGRDENGGDDWLYVTTEHPNGRVGDRIVVSYNTQEEAQNAGSAWKRFRIVEFEEVDPEENTWAESQGLKE